MCEHSNHHPHAKEVVNRLSRIVGHANAIKKMVEEGRDCSDILIQIAAVKSALDGVGKVILHDHITHCVVQAVEEHNMQALENLRDAIDKFIR